MVTLIFPNYHRYHLNSPPPLPISFSVTKTRLEMAKDFAQSEQLKEQINKVVTKEERDKAADACRIVEELHNVVQTTHYKNILQPILPENLIELSDQQREIDEAKIEAAKHLLGWQRVVGFSSGYVNRWMREMSAKNATKILDQQCELLLQHKNCPSITEIHGTRQLLRYISNFEQEIDKKRQELKNFLSALLAEINLDAMKLDNDISVHSLILQAVKLKNALPIVPGTIGKIPHDLPQQIPHLNTSSSKTPPNNEELQRLLHIAEKVSNLEDLNFSDTLSFVDYERVNQVLSLDEKINDFTLEYHQLKHEKGLKRWQSGILTAKDDLLKYQQESEDMRWECVEASYRDQLQLGEFGENLQASSVATWIMVERL